VPRTASKVRWGGSKVPWTASKVRWGASKVPWSASKVRWGASKVPWGGSKVSWTAASLTKGASKPTKGFAQQALARGQRRLPGSPAAHGAWVRSGRALACAASDVRCDSPVGLAPASMLRCSLRQSRWPRTSVNAPMFAATVPLAAHQRQRSDVRCDSPVGLAPASMLRCSLRQPRRPARLPPDGGRVCTTLWRGRLVGIWRAA
jgi:hypothetical protein